MKRHTALAQEYPPHARKEGEDYMGTYLKLDEREALVCVFTGAVSQDRPNVDIKREDGSSFHARHSLEVRMAGCHIGWVTGMHLDGAWNLCMTAEVDAAHNVPSDYEFAPHTRCIINDKGDVQHKRLEWVELGDPEHIDRFPV